MTFEFEPSAYLIDRDPLWRRVVTSRGVQMIVLILIVGGVGWSWATSQGGLEVIRTRFGIWAAIPLMLLQASVTVTPFPDELIGFANSAIYGFGLGFMLNWAAWMLGALIEYAVARRSAYDFDFDPEQLNARMPSILRRYSAEHPIYLILARQVPFGGHIVNSWAGAFQVPLWRFVWTGALGMVPGSIAIAAAANGLISWAT